MTFALLLLGVVSGLDPGTQGPIVDTAWTASWQFSYHPVTPHVRLLHAHTTLHPSLFDPHRVRTPFDWDYASGQSRAPLIPQCTVTFSLCRRFRGKATFPAGCSSATLLGISLPLAVADGATYPARTCAIGSLTGSSWPARLPRFPASSASALVLCCRRRQTMAASWGGSTMSQDTWCRSTG